MPINASYLELCNRVTTWGRGVVGIHIAPYPQLPHGHVAALLGYRDIIEMIEFWEDKDTDTLQALCGPHGYAIYRMLLINRQLLPEEE